MGLKWFCESLLQPPPLALVSGTCEGDLACRFLSLYRVGGLGGFLRKEWSGKERGQRVRRKREMRRGVDMQNSRRERGNKKKMKTGRIRAGRVKLLRFMSITKEMYL